MASGVNARGIIQFATRFTYHQNERGYTFAQATEAYEAAMLQTFSLKECLKFDQRNLPIANILFIANERGWPWFTEDDYWYLRFMLNVKHASNVLS